MNFSLIRGDDRTFALEFKKDGVPQDITGWTIFFTLKRSLYDSDNDALIKKTVTVHTDPTNGKTEFSITSAETDSLSGTYYYDIQYKDTGNKINTVMIGTMNFQEDVTRRTS
jgi:hypothetical protein